MSKKSHVEQSTGCQENSKMRSTCSLLVIISAFCAIYLPVLNADKETGELKIEVIEKPEECPQKTKVGDSLAMHYTGRLLDGRKFDSSHDRGQTFDFTLGKGMVIQGWEQGLLDMCVGEKRKLTIPPHLAYGDQGFGDLIPAGSTLQMDVELVNIKDSANGEARPESNIFGMIDKDKDKQLSHQEIKDYLKEHGTVPEDGKAENHDNIISEIFQTEDKNKDGVISFEEFSGPKDEL